MKPEEIDQVPAGAELDALIAEHVLGCKPVRSNRDKGKDYYCTCKNEAHTPNSDDRYQIYKYSSEIGAAWLVVDHLQKENYCVSLFISMGDEAAEAYGRPWSCQLYHPTRKPTEQNRKDESKWFAWASGETPMLAICRVALKTVIGVMND